jgi:hypothetical protein
VLSTFNEENGEQRNTARDYSEAKRNITFPAEEMARKRSWLILYGMMVSSDSERISSL